MLELAEPVAVVCHDAGAANIILATLRAEPDRLYLPVMQGPAAALWQASGLAPACTLPLKTALAGAGSLLSGTGWASDLEHEARRCAKASGLPSVAVIDHWVNYAERFERAGEQVLPDEIWVGDADALAIAARTFAGTRLRQIPNLYLSQQIAAIAAPAPSQAGHILYVLEPIRYSWRGATQAGEFEALDYFLANLDRLGERRDWSIRLRPHPSDRAGKYDDWLSRQPGFDIALDDSPNLAAAIGWAEWVAGCETTALVIALGAGRKTLSTLPPAAPPCRLPQAGLRHLRELSAPP
ncbi:hypothetical protein [Variovorax terrae]|uniref:Uncharacterized protein n=1 Tax=Variovorax terrae TaxID=2923278 RepID=A0A9X1VVS3_9BURK|nr:hypothetical protein [Variovorax terrae]MCJ0764277.1 hypothetical protein [Variovorax terrae]